MTKESKGKASRLKIRLYRFKFLPFQSLNCLEFVYFSIIHFKHLVRNLCFFSSLFVNCNKSHHSFTFYLTSAFRPSLHPEVSRTAQDGGSRWRSEGTEVIDFLCNFQMGIFYRSLIELTHNFGRNQNTYSKVVGDHTIWSQSFQGAPSTFIFKYSSILVPVPCE